MATCPRCGGSHPDGVTDCPACSEAPPLPDGGGGGNRVDLRERVVADRGLIKHIQASIPGWREYRDKEDLRIADALLRTQLADRFDRLILPALEGGREDAAERLDLQAAREIAALVDGARSTGAHIRHAEQGYSGISAAYAVDAAALGRLYDYDYALVAAVEEVERDAARARTAGRTEDGPGLADACRRVAAGLAAIGDVIGERREAMAAIGVFT